MPLRHARILEATAAITAELEAIRAEIGVTPDFPPEVEAAAAQSLRDAVLPDTDNTDIPFVTIDPEGAMDLDQALHIAPDGDGHLVHYAIADLPVFVAVGGPIDQEARRRGQTLYAPDLSVPLHPRVISERGASLLEGQVRSAYVWAMRLDAHGVVTSTELTRARVRSRSRLSYVEAQERIAAGDGLLTPLRTVGERRVALEGARGGASLDMPEEEIVHTRTGWHIMRRDVRPVEQWNAQISLMTGMEAARLQLAGGSGVIRTMPRPATSDLTTFRRQCAALGIVWPEGVTYGAFLRGLDRSRPVSVAVLTAARRLFRGAGYHVITGPISDSDAIHAAIGAPYAHTTAPLRRLVDRYALAHSYAHANGTPVPAWARAGLDGLPKIMQETGSQASRLERESLDVIEVAVLQGRVGDAFDAVITERRNEAIARIQLVDPPVEATCETQGEAGTTVRVVLVEANLSAHTLRFTDGSSPAAASTEGPVAAAPSAAVGGGADNR